ncbi:MAG: hypothetical protein VCE12_06880, partial [Candidatus Latescibacterota bacterium]
RVAGRKQSVSKSVFHSVGKWQVMTHRLRDTCATTLLDHRVELDRVQVILGRRCRDAAATAMAPPQSSRSPSSSTAGGTAGAQAASAVYYARLEAFAERRVRSMVLLR